MMIISIATLEHVNDPNDITKDKDTQITDIHKRLFGGGLFIGSQEVSADELGVLAPVSGVAWGLPAAYPKITIESGQYKEIKVGSLRNDYLVSKYVIQESIF